ncbi:MAG: enolase C-terminal domain-like protein [Bryobacteraceae bacterium]
MPAPTITGLTVRPVRVPMPDPHRTASGAVAESPLVLVYVHTSEGVTGRAVVFTYTPSALAPTAAMAANLEPLVQGETLAPAAVTNKLAARFRLLGTQGLTGMALAGLDMAMWDAFSRLHQLSLAEQLGGVQRPIPAYGAVGYDGPAESARVSARWAERGFRAVKAKIGYPTIAEDLEVIRAIRSATGPSMTILVDYNQSLTPVAAVERLRALEGEGLGWVEEPTLAHDFAGHARIAGEIATPIQCGENWWGPGDVRAAIAASASDYVMLDVMKIGGVTGWLAASALCAAANIPVSSHLWPEISTQLLSVTPTAHWLEYCDWWHAITLEPIAVRDGMAIPEALGAGVDFDEGAVRRFLVT